MNWIGYRRLEEFLMRIPNKIKRIYAKILGRNYIEDYIRVYPFENVYNPLGTKVDYTEEHHKNYLNHRKFYDFVCQFVIKNKSKVLDAGCGSGYGAKIIKDFGARKVVGIDLSTHAINFAKKTFADYADFRLCGITNLKEFKNNTFELSICNEVLEHVKEYEKEEQTLHGLKRITKDGGLVVVGTPNDEMLPNHGFSFSEINSLFSSLFQNFIIIENAFLPPMDRMHLWESRFKRGETGICVNQNINLKESVACETLSSLEKKDGVNEEIIRQNRIEFKTSLLHNTHSWIILAKC